jgi:hypothetical protein
LILEVTPAATVWGGWPLNHSGRPGSAYKPVVISGSMMILICLAASIYPAMLAARLDPVKAMNRV